MRDRTRRERWKDVGIAALALAALVMTVQLTGLPDFLRARNAGADSGAPVTDRASLLGPYAAAVTLSDGTRCGAAWGSGSQAIYERFSALLGEALGSAGNPVRATVESWREALSGPRAAASGPAGRMAGSPDSGVGRRGQRRGTGPGAGG